ncbi:MAG TPA: histidine kinase [Clostridiaceae bacterium]|nr:histidine kinase [Clostridiaceae bacterium]
MEHNLKKKFLIKNLLIFSVPTFIPLLILSITFVTIVAFFLRTEIDKNKANLLLQTKDRLENTFLSIESVGFTLSTNRELTMNLKNILKSNVLTYENYINYRTIRNFIYTQTNSNRAISSIYLYMDNPNKNFFCSNGGIHSIKTYYDTGWYDFYYNSADNKHVGFYKRMVFTSFDKSIKAEYLTIYQSIPFASHDDKSGIIVINILTEYINNMLNDLRVSPGEAILIVSDKNEIIAYSKEFVNIINSIGGELTGNSIFNEELLGINYIISYMKSSIYNWQYVSIVPKNSAYALIKRLYYITFLLLAISLFVGFILALCMTKKICNSTNKIIDIFDKAIAGQISIKYPEKIKNEYDYIIYNIINIFKEHNYLKIQLSEKKLKLQVMELIALQSQIRPHFLYNTLQTIYLMVLGFTKKPNKVNYMLENLMTILKYSLSNPVNVVTLRDEIENTKSYIALQKYQYGDRLSISWKLCDGIDNIIDNIKVPKLIIQPLIENSICHGMKENDSSLKIKIKLQKQGSYIVLTVTDNGCGIEKQRLTMIQRKLYEETHYLASNEASNKALGEASSKALNNPSCKASNEAWEESDKISNELSETSDKASNEASEALDELSDGRILYGKPGSTSDSFTKHIGLINTARRLSLLYGATVHNPNEIIKIRSKYLFGTSVRIKIPCNENRESQQ